MDLSITQEFERVLEGMEWDEVVSTLTDVINDMLTETALPTPPPLPLPPVPTQLELSHHLQPADTVGGFYSEGQHQTVPTVAFPQQMEQLLHPVGFLNGELLYEIKPNVFGPCHFAAPPVTAFKPKKRNRTNQQDDSHPYITKPLNAFLIFTKQQREKVMEELQIRDSATLTTVLGKMWRSLPKEEKAKYYEEVKKEKQLQAEQHPGWSGACNYMSTQHKDAECDTAPEERSKGMEQTSACTTPPLYQAQQEWP